jgi:hypothetical protein
MLDKWAPPRHDMAGSCDTIKEPTVTKLPENNKRSNSHPLQSHLEEIIRFIKLAVDDKQAAHEVEKELWRRVVKLGRDAMQLFFNLHGDGDEGEQVTLADGNTVKRLEHNHKREYLSVFGEFELWRVVYGIRKGQKIEYVPLDSRLQLPQCKFSYLLQDWDQSTTLEMPFKQVNVMLEKILGLRQSVHSLERSGRKLAADVPAFWEAQPIPPAQEEGALLVCSADGKGVPMRQAMEKNGVEEMKPDKGMRAGSKKMALVGAVYTVEPYLRTPQEVFNALFCPRDTTTEPASARPKPCFKRVRAALMRDEADTTAPQVETIFGWMAQEAINRSITTPRSLILLMDGQESLWNAGLEYLPEHRFEVTEILDLLHAVSYVWRAAHLFHPSGSGQAFKLVEKQMQRLLKGEVEKVIRSLRTMATRRRLSGTNREELERICGYFRNNAGRMAYDEYLALGYPIASGVIEGACRTVVNDRMERSGMRWVFEGAHAMLGLRSLSLSGLWDDFISFHIDQESKRLYPNSAANDDNIQLPLVA